MKKWLLWLGLALIIASGIILFNINKVVKKDTIHEGISIDEIDVSGKKKEDALKIIQDKKESELKQKKMNLKGKDKQYDIKLEEIGFKYEYKKAIDEAYALGRKGNLFEKYKKIKQIKKEKEKIELESNYDKKKIEEKVSTIAKEIDTEVIDSKFNFNNGNISITDEKVGYKIDEQKLISQIEENIYILDDINIPIDTIKPKYTKEYFSKINGVIGEASTSFNSSGAGRVNNIKISARAFNGRIVHPGENVSYNSTLGPVNISTGYQDAPVIVAGDLQPGVGGGICQTSTTLYNALLNADLTVTERSHHSIPSAYIDKGLDAVIAGDYLDLKFRNDFDYPIYISSWVSGRTVYFKIYGDKKSRDYTIQMQPQITKVIPHKVREIVKKDMKPGTREVAQQGRDGYMVVTYKHKIKNGKIVETKQISSDYYRERETIYHIGPKAQTSVKPQQKTPN
ncbi:VanW family protein [Tissierella creatinophila]|uniref:Vancomycin B-type resistance protein VanW n=1 Tax=Tissierella creatinophila DSM 6911 TaxID=1123403 RepID=A0A1U7M9H9_TISCR|nr:VanW family protein [Tissierella creatinophila]OLS03858.1 vancomycin B-type resistance protein VanW [Tissierella creatinophila DSM 6911]